MAGSIAARLGYERWAWETPVTLGRDIVAADARDAGERVPC